MPALDQLGLATKAQQKLNLGKFGIKSVEGSLSVGGGSLRLRLDWPWHIAEPRYDGPPNRRS